MEKLKVLFICKDSSVRSQLAVAFLNAYFGDRYEACYAGIESSELNPYDEFDCIITLCDFALAHLSVLPEHKKQLHQGFKDFCVPMLCENAKKFPMCFPVQKKTLQRGHYNTKEIEKDKLLAFRYLREAIFYWVENEMVF